MDALQKSAALLVVIATSISPFAVQAQSTGQTFSVDSDTIDSADEQLRAAEAALLQSLGSQNKGSIQPEQFDSPQLERAPQRDLSDAQFGLEKTAVIKKTVPLQRKAKPASLSQNVAGELQSLHGSNAKLHKSLSSLKKKQKSLSSQVQSKDKRISSLMGQLKSARNRLMIAEAEVERLSSIIEEWNNSKIAQYSNAATRGSYSAKPRRKAAKFEAPGTKADQDMLIATVTVNKANLRTGPGKENSPLMTVSKGTRLAVETRLGDWYRVISPTGTRAWVSTDVVKFGKKIRTSPTRTVKVKGYDTSLEDEAFEFIRNSSR